MQTTCLPTDKRVVAKMNDLARAGVRRVAEMRRHVEIFVREELFSGQTVPEVSDSRFWPSGRTILNAIYNARKQLRFACYFFASMQSMTILNKAISMVSAP